MRIELTVNEGSLVGTIAIDLERGRASMTKDITKLIAILAFASGGAANAESFTFESQMDAPPVSVGGARADGSRYGGNYFTGTSAGTASNGTKTQTKYTCISMTTPPTDSIFKMHSICDVTSNEGNYAVVLGCDILGPEENSCIGGMYGKTGIYKGRRGNITTHGKGAKGNGTGQWIN